MSKIAQRTEIIWTPDDPLDLLAVDVDGNCSETEFLGMLAINQAGRDWLTGKIDTVEYLDKLEFYGIPDPFEILDEFADHVELVISHG
ncbi:hypothetical protein ACE1AT_13925 [Pelatocladus sp. BLCC-F211]|uniref:hypothetical protein n=1 Tax=Pelatocladus sp. BLCC-F211 TaxID=3342752 RepID=UPI000B5E9AA8|nr:hypothetical protein NIES4106_10190 [Fischerella sp. NIES-4106]BAZ70553.1 hypothetical protein NIES4106_53480 [Fischerella sp. NIES-4106]